MSVRDITPDAVLAAVRAGDDDVFKLAETFEVMHVSHTLRTTIALLNDAGRLHVVRRREDNTAVLAVA